VGLPIFARGLSIRGTGKDQRAIGWINAPVLFDGVTVQPGDLVVGDADGVVAIPRALAPEVVEAAGRRERLEGDVMRRLREGERTLDVYQF
jgi:4-hydroxy-4-methyl-2-oxoglutarate aldolase